MIYYRSSTVTRPYSCVESMRDFGVALTLMLPTVPMSPDSLASEYDVTRIGDHIATSKLTNFAGDHACAHQKLSAVLEGITIPESTGFNGTSPFGKFDEPVSSGVTSKSWLSSSGSGLTIPLSWDPTHTASVIAPGILSQASVTSSITNSKYPTRVRKGWCTKFSRVACIGPNVFVWIIADSTYIPGITDWYTVGALQLQVTVYSPKVRSGYPTQWRYVANTLINERNTSLESAKVYVFSPEIFWADKIQAALDQAAASSWSQEIALLQYYSDQFQSDLTSSSVATATAGHIASDIRKFANDVAFTVSPPDKNVWSDLCVTALQSCQQLNINSIAYAKDLIGLKSEISAIKQLVLGWKKPKTYLKAFLSFQYGIRLTMSDTKSLVDAIAQEASAWTKDYSAVRAQSVDFPSTHYRTCTSVVRQFNYKVYYNPVDSRVLDCIRGLMDWDLWPTLQNDWDLIPLSFVVDWFIGVEDLCNRIDTCIYSEYLDVLSVLRTTKTTYTLQCDLSHYGVNDAVVSAVWYNRTYETALDLPSFYLKPNSGFLTHLPELTSILALLTH